MNKIKAHFEQLLLAVKKEREEDRAQYHEKMMYTTFQERKDQGICWYPVAITKNYLGTGERIVIQVEKTVQDQQKHVFQPGSSVSLFVNSGGKKLKNASGVISQIRDQKMKIILNGEEEPEWLNEGKLGVNLLFDESTYEEMENTLRKLIRTDNDRSTELAKIMLGEGEAFFEKGTHAVDYPDLNHSQSKAVGTILTARDGCIVHGPPGTGKTTTLVRAITEVVATEKQVLVSAPSNAAVDLLVEKLALKGVDVLRIGHPARVTPAVVENSLDARIAAHPEFKELKNIRKKSEELRKIGGKYKRNFGHEERRQRKMLYNEARKLKDEAMMLEYYITNTLMDNAQVIACTLVGANHTFVKDRNFKTVFIDEAGQAMEPACWIPIMRAKRVVMAGDHQQLPPTVKSLEASKMGLSVTLFERFITRKIGVNMLAVQYRMHQSIVKFSSDYFYEGQLHSDQSLARREVPFHQGALFIDTAGCGFDSKLNEKTRSTYNQEESEFLLKRLEAFVTENGLEQLQESNCKIGIITPYKAQNELVRAGIKERETLTALGSNLEVNTVDAFQGQERDVIFI
ncbi:MAG: AAA domain-containing protein, partial [Bacteroidota bacterium]